jgi:hypothetical protein
MMRLKEAKVHLTSSSPPFTRALFFSGAFFFLPPPPPTTTHSPPRLGVPDARLAAIAASPAPGWLWGLFLVVFSRCPVISMAIRGSQLVPSQVPVLSRPPPWSMVRGIDTKKAVFASNGS